LVLALLFFDQLSAPQSRPPRTDLRFPDAELAPYSSDVDGQRPADFHAPEWRVLEQASSRSRLSTDHHDLSD